LRLPEFLYNRHTKVAWLSVLPIGHLYPSVDSKAIVWPKG